MTTDDRRILALAVPALGSLAVEPVYVLVDTAIVGRLGTEQLAGLAIAATVLSFVFAGANFLTYGTTERVARRLGAGATAEAADVGVQALWLAAMFGVPAAVVLAFGAEGLTGAFGASGAVADHATTYLSISAVGVPFFLVTLAAQGVLRGASNYTEYHPQTRNAADEIRNFKKKIDAGADAAITQYFFSADPYFRFVEECRAAGIEVPIIAGVMPILNFSQLARFSDVCGAEIPRWIRFKLESFRDDSASIQAFGIDVVAAMCERLLAGGAPGLHFYTLNQAPLSAEICKRLGV